MALVLQGPVDPASEPVERRRALRVELTDCRATAKQNRAQRRTHRLPRKDRR
jgi:hypothetical protein